MSRRILEAVTPNEQVMLDRWCQLLRDAIKPDAGVSPAEHEKRVNAVLRLIRSDCMLVMEGHQTEE